MSNLAIKAGRKLFERNLQQYQPADPMYETYVDKKGRQRRRRRAIPPGLSERDAKILKSVQRRAHYLDKGFSLCGLRFGWTFVIGIIPGAGDIADATLNYVLVVRKAKQAEIPDWLLRKMLLNNAVSALVGFIPFAGDVILAMFKANSRNAALLEEFLRIRGEEFLKAEQERVQDPHTVKPGAGREPGEHVAGKQERSGTGFGGGWFGRGGKSNKKGKDKSPVAPSPVSPSADRGRFVEDVPPATTNDHPDGKQH
ncbi:hypothetical protein BN946_scf184883.g10 [Trametes cinnabarina]|uniref:PH domain-containing protein n=1 Tax=Pycnoporus cinnabarinus TaxID=5643 RepID=A0A060SSV9_PYCCI|nr:hypothetical protein BN946_scf184883.g10 [Trametes cinnabarina]